MPGPLGDSAISLIPIEHPDYLVGSGSPIGARFWVGIFNMLLMALCTLGNRVVSI